MSRTDRLLQEIESPTTPPAIRDQLADAFENYKRMAAEVERLKTLTMDLRVENGSLVAEVKMLREQLEVSETDRVRLQAIASTFVGGIRALGAGFDSLYELAKKNGLEAAAQAASAQEMEAAGAEAREIFERVPVDPVEAEETTATKLPANPL